MKIKTIKIVENEGDGDGGSGGLKLMKCSAVALSTLSLLPLLRMHFYFNQFFRTHLDNICTYVHDKLFLQSSRR